MGQHAMRVSKELVAPWLPNIGTMDAPSSCSLIYSSIVTRVASVSSHQRQASFETRRPPNPALWVISFSPKHRVINWVKKLQTSSPEKPISYCWLIYIYIIYMPTIKLIGLLVNTARFVGQFHHHHHHHHHPFLETLPILADWTWLNYGIHQCLLVKSHGHHHFCWLNPMEITMLGLWAHGI